MKNISVKSKITFWFAFVLVLMVAFTYIILFSISRNLAREDIKAKLALTVKSNSEEIEYFNSIDSQDPDDGDHYLIYLDGFLEIDDDFCDIKDTICTSLCDREGNVLYGENPIVLDCPTEPDEQIITSLTATGGTQYYLYDVCLKGENLDGLWLRGVVRQDAGDTVIDKILGVSVILFPALAIIAVLIGWIMAARTLKPIKKIAATADDIRKGNDLSRRIDIGEGSDELHALAQSFDAMFDSLESMFEAEKQFTSDASHELRTPTAVILAQCEYALEQPRRESEYIDTLNVIERQATKMSRLVSQMLSYTRLEQKAKTLTKTEVDLSELVTQVCEEHESSNVGNISIHYSIKNGITLMGDTDLLIRLTDNLIQNAYKYGKPGGNVDVKLFTEGDEIVLKVSDDGIGVAPEHISRVFDRFYRVNSSATGNVKGTGLGLSIVRKIAEIHNGCAFAESTLGEGSVFTIKFKKNK